MCDHCEHIKPVLENDNSRVFLVGSRLVLQDKTKPIVDGEGIPLYPSQWVHLHTNECPFCGHCLESTADGQGCPTTVDSTESGESLRSRIMAYLRAIRKHFLIG